MKEIHPEKQQILEKMKAFKVFQYLNDEEREDLLAIASILQFESGENVITEGDVSPYLYTVLEGSVSITVQKEEKQIFISSIGVGDVFGEAAIFLNTKRTASATPSDYAVLMRVERQDLMNFIKSHPGAGVKILMLIIHSLLNKLREANQELAFERKSFIKQDQVDELLKQIM